MPELTSIPVRNPDIIGRMVDNETVLVMPQQGQVKVLNEVGGAIWEMTDGKRTIAEIAERICTQFAVDLNTAQADTLKFFAELIDRGIVFFSPV